MLTLAKIQSSKLITSYALPPQASITCPPYSLRLKLGKGRAERRTYVATTEASAHITLFKDALNAEGQSEPSTAIHKLTSTENPVVFLGLAHEKIESSTDNLLVVKSDGEMHCLNSEDLTLHWTSPAAAVTKNSTTPDAPSQKVELVSVTDAFTAGKGLLRAHPDAFSIFTETIEQDGFNPTLVVLITSPAESALAANRTLHVFSLPQYADGQTHSAQALLSFSLPWVHARLPAQYASLQYDIHVASGLLYELAGRTLSIYDLTDSTPKTKSQLVIDNVSSFLRLSAAAVMAATNETVDIYNPTFHSIQASVEIEAGQEGAVSRKRKLDDDEPVAQGCKLVSYSPKHNLAHAIIGTELVAFPIEAKKDGSVRRRALGLLVDSLGCSVRDNTTESLPKLKQTGLSSLPRYIPGTKSMSDAALKEKFAQLDTFVASQDIAGFEEVMSKELGIALEPTTAEGAIPGWIWPTSRAAYPAVDPRFAQYALSRIFSFSTSSSDATQKLIIVFYPHNVVNWLLETGNLNKPAIGSALKRESHEVRDIPPGQLVEALVDVDREMKSLLAFLQHNYLDADELVHAIRILMESLGIFGDAKAEKPLLLTNGEPSDAPAQTNGDVEDELEMQTAEIEAALQLAEYRLGDGASIRDQALSLSLSKLHACPAINVVSAMKEHLSPAEIVSLTYLLRFELARGAWTRKYLDSSMDEEESEEEQRQDSTIVLISSLVSICIDALGSSGWLDGSDGGAKFGAEELISNLKLEISAALEGVEEATYLRGLVGEVVRYGQAVLKTLPQDENGEPKEGGKKKRRKTKNVDIKPQTLHDLPDSSLPFGLKVQGQVSAMKVGAGGEVSRRSRRDIGQLKSRLVGKYSRERIVI